MMGKIKKAEVKKAKGVYIPDGVKKQMATYYDKKFPYKAIAKWAHPLTNQEISIRHNDSTIRNIYLESETELKRLFCYPQPIERAEIGEYEGLGRAWTFDVDDYKPCEAHDKKEICATCWDTQMVPKISILVNHIKKNYGFEKVVCCFSGGRSVQIWVRDEVAQVYSKEQRLQVYHKLPIKIDEGCFTTMNMTLRMPFTIHPTTFRLCIPFDANKCLAKDVFIDFRHVTKAQMDEAIKQLG
jgi:DNA primase catalytic subunit